MRALAIDTVSEMCSVALGVGDQVINREYHAVNKHSDLVLDMVDEVMCEASIQLTDLDVIICDVGPGSFTGIRIGIGVAQGLAFGANIPMIAVDSLTTLATSVKTQDNVLASIDARMNQIYWAYYCYQEDKLQLKGTLNLSAPEQVTKIFEQTVGVGSGFGVYSKQLKAQCVKIEMVGERFPLAKYGLEIAKQVSPSKWYEASEIVPIYLRNKVATPSSKKLL